MDYEYTTGHMGFAGFLHFVLGPETHIATTVAENHRVTFVFDDSSGRCRELGDAFFSPEGAAVNDSRALLESARDIKRTIGLAEASGGVWQQ